MDARSEAAPARLTTAEFEELALPVMNDLFRTALRMTGDRARAEDAVQETYLQAWKSLNRFEVGTNLRAWMFRILFHTVSHQRRRLFRFPGIRDNEDLLEETLVSPEPVAEHLTDQAILGALDQITEDYRAVILLVDVEEFAYREAADILGVPMGTVMSRLSRGRAALRRRLGDVARSYGIGQTESAKGGAA